MSRSLLACCSHRTNWCKVSRVAKQDGPAAVNPFMPLDGTHLHSTKAQMRQCKCGTKPLSEAASQAEALKHV